jgi:hypothetical protein
MTSSILARINALDWNAAGESLSERGHAVTAPILTPEECASVVALYPDDSRFAATW